MSFHKGPLENEFVLEKRLAFSVQTMDNNAVAVVQSGNTTGASSRAELFDTHANEIAVGIEVVGHVPKLMAQWVEKFLKCASYSGTVVITGKQINRGAGYGLKFSPGLNFKATNICDWVKENLKKKNFDVL